MGRLSRPTDRSGSRTGTRFSKSRPPGLSGAFTEHLLPGVDRCQHRSLVGIAEVPPPGDLFQIPQGQTTFSRFLARGERKLCCGPDFRCLISAPDVRSPEIGQRETAPIGWLLRLDANPF